MSKQQKESYKERQHDWLINNHLLYEALATELELETISDLLHCSNRTSRETISEMAAYFPVLSLSSKKGYRRAKKIEGLSSLELQAEIDAVKHQIKEHNSRIKVIKKRMKPLIAWLKISQKKEGNENVR